MTTHTLSRTCFGLFGALCIAQAAWAQTVLPADQVGNIGTNDWNLSQSFSIPFYMPNSLPVLTANYGDTDKNVGLLQFDLTEVTAPVASAQLEIYHGLNQLGVGSTAEFDLFRNLSSWSPTIDQWSDLPLVAPKAVATNLIADSDVGLFRSWDVTSVVNAWISGSAENFGFRLERTDALSPYIYFSSADGFFLDTALYAPQLTLTTASVSAVPEPSSYGLVGALVLGGLVVRLRLRRRSATV